MRCPPEPLNQRPSEALQRSARARAARISPPQAHRLGLSVSLVAGVATVVIALSACGGGGSTTMPSAQPLAALEPVADGALVPKVREMLRSRQSARVANPGVSFDRFAVTATGGLTATSAQAAPAAPPTFSGTNV